MTGQSKCMLICVDGPDRTGKETQSKLLRDYLQRSGKKVKLIEIPVRSPITYRAIYWMLKNGWAKKYPSLFQITHYLNKKFFQEVHLPRLMRDNDVVIFDRWSISMIVYGDATNADPTISSELYDTLVTPDATIITAGKAFPKKNLDVYEEDSRLQRDVRVGYEQWAKCHSHNCRLVTNEGGHGAIHQRVLKALRELNIDV